MAVLGDTACKQYGERDGSCCKEGYKYHMRARLRDDTYCCGKKNHKYCIVADPSVDVNVLKSHAKEKQYSEGPCKYGRQMLSDDMVPEVFLYEMVGSKDKDQQDDYTEPGKEHIHPLFVKKVDLEGPVLVIMM